MRRYLSHSAQGFFPAGSMVPTTKREVVKLLNKAARAYMSVHMSDETFFVVEHLVRDVPATNRDRIILSAIMGHMVEWRETRTIVTVSMTALWSGTICLCVTMVMLNPDSEFDVGMAFAFACISTLNLVYLVVRRALSIRHVDMLIGQMQMAIDGIIVVHAA
jgi:hypothetical protein